MGTTIYEHLAVIRASDKEMLEKAHKLHKNDKKLIKVNNRTWICVPKKTSKEVIKAKIENINRNTL